MQAARRTIVLYWDDSSDPDNPGYVARCTEFDEHGQPILGRIAMDQQVESMRLDEAIQEAALYWSCAEEEVVLYTGPT